MSLMIAIDELVEENSQFVIATHSPILMTYPKAEILEMTDTGDTQSSNIQRQNIIKSQNSFWMTLNEC